MRRTIVATCPARLLTRGDVISIDGVELELTAVFPLPTRVEVSHLDAGWRVGTDVFEPDQELEFVRSAAQAVTA
jgi:hypothetical protein